jgi:hypothetical protein
MMDRILIDIDNNTPGAIARRIVEFIVPSSKCRLQMKKIRIAIYHFSMVNKYFNNIINLLLPQCNINSFFDGQKLCANHSDDYEQLLGIHRRIKQAQIDGVIYYHFETIDTKNVFQKYIGKRHTCCSGKGFQLNTMKWECWAY